MKKICKMGGGLLALLFCIFGLQMMTIDAEEIGYVLGQEEAYSGESTMIFPDSTSLDTLIESIRKNPVKWKQVKTLKVKEGIDRKRK